MKATNFTKGQLVIANPYGKAVEGRVVKQCGVSKSDFTDERGKCCIVQWKMDNGRYVTVGASLTFLNKHLSLR